MDIPLDISTSIGQVLSNFFLLRYPFRSATGTRILLVRDNKVFTSEVGFIASSFDAANTVLSPSLYNTFCKPNGEYLCCRNHDRFPDSKILLFVAATIRRRVT